MISKIRNSKILVLTPFLVWSMLLLNGFTNRHHHVDGRGQIISHAHPIQDGDEDHDHTAEELIFWDLISNPLIQFENPEVLIPENIFTVTYYTQENYSQPFFKQSLSATDFLRGPPILV